MIKQMVVGFYWDLILGCWVWILRALAELREVKGLQDYCCKTLKMVKLLRLPIILSVEHGVLVMIVGFQSGEFQFETYGEPIFNSCFM